MQCWALYKELHEPNFYILIIQTSSPQEDKERDEPLEIILQTHGGTYVLIMPGR